MRRKDPTPVYSAGRGRSLISSRTHQQQQQRNMIPTPRSLLPRSYSSPSAQSDHESAPQPSQRGYVMRSFSTPEPKPKEYRRNSDSFYRPKTHGSRSELDSDLESFEQFEESFVDMDDDQEQNAYGTYGRSPEKEKPKRVTATLLQGSGLQRISIRPVSSCTTQTLYSAREAMKELQRTEQKSRLNFRPLTVNLPRSHSDHEQLSQEEELQASPQLELDTVELDQQLHLEQQFMEQGVAMATEESDADTVSTFY